MRETLLNILNRMATIKMLPNLGNLSWESYDYKYDLKIHIDLQIVKLLKWKQFQMLIWIFLYNEFYWYAYAMIFTVRFAD